MSPNRTTDPRPSLRGRELLLGVSGSIAAYKAAELVSLLVKRGAGVTVLMTPGAARFIGPLTLATLSRRPVVSDLFDPSCPDVEHIQMTERADALLVAPATANTLAKLAAGIADCPVTTAALALKPSTPLILAPAMNTRMWEHPATRENLRTLKSRGARIVAPAEGLLACGTVGVGKLAALDDILAALEKALR